MRDTQTLDVGRLIDDGGIGLPQISIIGLCAFIALLDGLDVQSIGLAASGIGAELHIAPENFGFIFSAALAGLALGAFVLGPLGDQVGRKRILIGSTLFFGLFTIATAFASSPTTLVIYRFCADVGLGGAMPSFVTLAADYAPRQSRATIVSLLWVGFPLGGMTGGLLGSQLIPAYGWRSIFWVGGVTPLLLAAALIVLLPESLAFLINKKANAETIRRTVRRVFPRQDLTGKQSFILAQETEQHGSVGELFSEGRALGTIMLWLACFFVFMILVTNSSWTPLLLRREGIEIAQSSLAMAIYNIGSVIGSASVGILLARWRPTIVLAGSIFLGAIAYGSIGWLAPSFPAIILSEGLFGLLLGCASAGLIGLGAVFYPSSVRATGVGWATAIGRVGSFVGPLVIGGLVVMHLTPTAIFSTLSIVTLIGALACLLLELPGKSTAVGSAAS